MEFRSSVKKKKKKNLNFKKNKREFYKKCLSHFPQDSNPDCKVEFEPLQTYKGPEVSIEFGKKK